MFQNCINIIELHLPLFNTQNCEKFSFLFDGCYNLIIKINSSIFNLSYDFPEYVQIIDINE